MSPSDMPPEHCGEGPTPRLNTLQILPGVNVPTPAAPLNRLLTLLVDERYDRRHLEAITRPLGDLPGDAKLQFFLTPRGSPSRRSPLQALARGRVADVNAASEAFAHG